MVAIAVSYFFMSITTSVAAAQGERTVVLPAALGPLDNPMKGWCTYTIPHIPLRQPYTMAFKYVRWKDLEPQEGDFELAAWEKSAWNDPMTVGKKIVFRLYLDYPGQPTAVPDWVLAKGVKMRHYTDMGGGDSPDYDNPDLVNGLLGLIAALGKRYDHDPRVAFVEIGTLGFWGEWHTFPHDDFFADAATQKTIVDAYRQAFPDKILMGRYASGYLGEQDWLGYYDDSFPIDTEQPQSWDFLPRMKVAGRTENWRRGVIGGEMYPGHAIDMLSDSNWSMTLSAIEDGHFTWIGPYNPAMEQNQTPQLVERSAQMVRTMGYQYCLQQIAYTPKVVVGGRIDVDIQAVNQGVAPFYYPWEVRLALLTLDGKRMVKSFPVQADIRTWQPGPFAIQASLPVHVAPGVYRIGIGIVDPETASPDIKFANDLPYSNGWTVLSYVRVSGAAKGGSRP
jgi:hypothetical protein